MLGRIRSSFEDGNPVGLELAGYALYDMFPERRGNLFGDEVYRLSKAHDATTAYDRSAAEGGDGDDGSDGAEEEGAGGKPRRGDHRNNNNKNDNSDFRRYLPRNHKFGNNDVVMLTLQPGGSGDYFGPSTLPTGDGAVAVEARVLGTGPTYVDVAVPAGTFEASFGPAPNDASGEGDGRMRLRADRFVSNVPYQRMVAALSQLTAVPDRRGRSASPDESAAAAAGDGSRRNSNSHDNIRMDEVLREAILSTHAFADPHSPLLRDPDVCNLEELVSSYIHPGFTRNPEP